jgi:hypothetical protein
METSNGVVEMSFEMKTGVGGNLKIELDLGAALDALCFN